MSQVDHRPYERRYGHPPDFLVRYRFLASDEGGRKEPVGQGYRCNWYYDGEDPHVTGKLWSIYPQFIDEHGNVYFDRFANEVGSASMWIPNAKLRAFHLDRLEVGVRGYMAEGPRPVAACEVTAIIALHDNPVAYE